MEVVHRADDVTGERVKVVQAINLVSEKLDAHSELFIGGDDVDRVAFDSENTTAKSDVITVILDLYEQFDEVISIEFVADAQQNRPVKVGLGVPKP